jgi:hypothetical protein
MEEEKKLTMEEAIAMRGTEFDYSVDGLKVKAFVKQVIPEKGASCFSMVAWKDGPFAKVYNHVPELEDDDTWCLMSYNFKNDSIRAYHLDRFLKDMYIIKTTGQFSIDDIQGGYITCSLR